MKQTEKNTRKILKKKGGITLIALVVTIIVLLILAGISIQMLTGDNSIINQAGNSKTLTEIAQEKEILGQATVAAVNKNRYGNVEKNYLDAELSRYPEVESTSQTGDKIQVTFKSGRTYFVDADGNIADNNVTTPDNNVTTPDNNVTAPDKYDFSFQCGDKGDNIVAYIVSKSDQTSGSYSNESYDLYLLGSGKMSNLTDVVCSQFDVWYWDDVEWSPSEHADLFKYFSWGYAFDETIKDVAINVPIDYIYISDGIENISQGYAQTVQSFSNIRIPSSLTEIKGLAFKGSSMSGEVVIPDSVTVIHGGAFDDCLDITSVSIPNGVTAIWQDTFAGCKSLEYVFIPSSVTEIYKEAFRDCSGLRNIFIPASVEKVDALPFFRCGQLHIYCESEYEPSEFNNFWNYFNYKEELETEWGWSRTRYEAEIRND